MLEQRLPFWFLHTPVDTSCHACPAPVFSVSPTGQVAVPVFAGRTKDAEDNSLTTGFGFEHGIALIGGSASDPPRESTASWTHVKSRDLTNDTLATYCRYSISLETA